jgi:hypothetical protein
VLTATAGVSLAACAKVANPVPSGQPPSPSATHSSTSTPKTDGSSHPAAPLTGLPAASAAGAASPAVAVIVSGPAPAGLGPADVVYQEITSPSARYIAVFQSRQSGAVGPVTATRPADGQILSVLHPLTGYDGGSPSDVRILDKSGVTDLGVSTHPSLYTSTAAGLSTATGAMLHAASGDKAPPPIFRLRGSDTGATTLAPTGVSRRSSVRLTIPGYGTEVWAFDAHADRWVLDSGGPRVAVANLVVQTVSYKQIFLSHRQGITAPSARVIGSGRATVFSGTEPGGSGGTAATGTWSKPQRHDVTNYLGANGLPMALNPGPTWVVFAPQGTQVAASG